MKRRETPVYEISVLLYEEPLSAYANLFLDLFWLSINWLVLYAKMIDLNFLFRALSVMWPDADFLIGT